ncbi:TIGR02186 family protein [Curvivirga sp.]|uniref:TIGR02186 family protein n=1 Tax=Curvivirga sp. TaxID=2856848 RepID=UPI003B593EA9
MKVVSRFILLASIFIFPNLAAKAETLVADLSDHVVAITTGFTGTDLLLFGSVSDVGDVIVIVHGPTEEIVVRKKEQISGIWANKDSITFEHVPSFYSVAASPEAMSRVSSAVGRRHQIGAYNVRFDSKEDIDRQTAAPFKEALVRNKTKMGLYTKRPALVEMRGRHLFRTKVHFPANVPTGTYRVETLLLKEGTVIAAQNTPLFINKLGFGAQVFRFAHRHPALHGLAAIIIAVLAGLFANWVFRKLSQN